MILSGFQFCGFYCSSVDHTLGGLKAVQRGTERYRELQRGTERYRESPRFLHYLRLTLDTLDIRCLSSSSAVNGIQSSDSSNTVAAMLSICQNFLIDDVSSSVANGNFLIVTC